MVRTLDAYHSSQCSLLGYSIYRKQNGQPVATTEVITENKEPLSVWDDLIFVGKITEYISTPRSMEGSYYDELWAEDFRDDREDESEEEQWVDDDDDYYLEDE